MVWSEQATGWQRKFKLDRQQKLNVGGEKWCHLSDLGASARVRQMMTNTNSN